MPQPARSSLTFAERVARREAMFIRADWEPEYQRGVDAANRLIAGDDPGRVDFALSLVARQLSDWPESRPGKPNGMTDAQYAMTRGFGETLFEYRQEQGS